jgi:hypothetical protein
MRGSIKNPRHKVGENDLNNVDNIRREIGPLSECREILGGPA